MKSLILIIMTNQNFRFWHAHVPSLNAYEFIGWWWLHTLS